LDLPPHPPPVQNMKVLLTGGCGFIGGHTAERLLKRGDDVVVVDIMNSYYDVEIKKSCLKILEECAKNCAGKLVVHHVDIVDKAALREIFAQELPDAVCHLAAQAGVRYSIENLDENVSTNIIGTTNIFECAREFKVKNIVAASSSSVYGDTSKAPFSEDQWCGRPISPYAATKRACELFAYTFHHLYKLNITMLRFFTVYGPRGRPDMACYKFIDRITKGQAIDKYGDGSAIREFTYIDDIIDGVIASIDKVSSFEIVNLGGGSTHTLNELISTIEKHLGLKAKLNLLPDQPGDVPITSADQAVAKRVLGFAPQISLDEGVKRTVTWYKEYKDGQSGEAPLKKPKLI